jgi:hypothetical protein
MIFNQPRLMDIGFIFSLARSGSTLLRCLLGAQEQILATHELHFFLLEFNCFSSDYIKESFEKIGLNQSIVKKIFIEQLYDRVASDIYKSHEEVIFIDKTISNLKFHEEIYEFWPTSKFIFLKRDPKNIFKSLIPVYDWSIDEAFNHLCKYFEYYNKAKEICPSGYIEISYEDIISNAKKCISDILQYLNLEADNIVTEYNYNLSEHIFGLGDISENIKSGKILLLDHDDTIWLKYEDNIQIMRDKWEY